MSDESRLKIVVDGENNASAPIQQVDKDLVAMGATAAAVSAASVSSSSNLAASNEKVSKSFINMKSANADAANALGAFGINLAALNNPLMLVGDGLKASMDAAINWAGAVDKLATNTGMSVEAASLMGATFKSAGVDISTLETSIKTLTANGLPANMDTIKKLAGEYQALPPGVARSEFAFKNFGRASLEMTEILSKSPEELKKLEDAARTSGMVLSSDMVERMEAAQITMAQFQQKMEGMSVVAGGVVVDTLNSAGNALNSIIGLYNIAYISAGKFTGVITEEQAQVKYAAVAAGDWFAVLSDGGPVIEDATTATEDLNTTLEDNKTITGSSEYAMASFALTMKGVTDATLAKVEADQRAALMNDLLADGLSGNVNQALVSYQQVQADANAEIEKAKAEITRLTEEAARNGVALDGNSRAAQGYRDQIAEAQGVVDGLTGKMKDAKQAIRDATDEMIFQKASAGLDTQATLDLARSMGMIDEQAYATATATEALRQQYDKNGDGAITAAEGAKQFATDVLALRDKANELAEKLADGEITLADYKTQMDILAVGAGTANSALVIVSDTINGLQDKDVNVNYHINTYGSAPAQYGSEPGGPEGTVSGGGVGSTSGNENYGNQQDVFMPSSNTSNSFQSSGPTYIYNTTVYASGSNLTEDQIEAAVNRALDKRGELAQSRIRTGNR